MALELVVQYTQNNEIGNHWRLILTLPVAILDSTFYWWIFLALYKVITDLKFQKQHTKLRLYKRFTRVLLLSLVAAVVFALYQV